MTENGRGLSFNDSTYYDETTYYDDKQSLLQNLESPFQRYRVSSVLKIYRPNKNEKVLDLGCGWGTFCAALAPLCKEVTGVDFSSKSIEICTKLLSERGFANVKFVHASAQDTGLESESYDVIVSADLFEHLYPETFEDVMDECFRLLKKGGKLVTWTPHRGHVFEILKNNNIILKRPLAHVDYKSMPRLLDALKRRHFLVIKNYYVESHIPIFRILEKVLWRFLPLMRRRIAILAKKC